MMIPVKQLWGTAISEDFRGVYKHYVEHEDESIEKEYQELIHILDISQTTRLSRRVNEEIKSKTTLKVYKKRVTDYFLKLLYIYLSSADNEPFNMKALVNDAMGYATSEFLAASIVKCIS